MFKLIYLLTWCVKLGMSNEACIRWGTHWYHLVNTIEPSICAGDVVYVKLLLPLVLLDTTLKSFCCSIVV